MAFTCVSFIVLFLLSFSSAYGCLQPSCILGLNDSVIKIPAVYAFGNSSIDAGNNKFLPHATARFDFSPYGIDFLGGLPTGRTTNGKTVVDFMAESAGLPFPLPMLSLSKAQRKSTLTGVNYGSSASGIQGMPHKTTKIFVTPPGRHIKQLWFQVEPLAATEKPMPSSTLSTPRRECINYGPNAV